VRKCQDKKRNGGGKMADTDKKRVLTVICKSCGQMIQLFNLPPNVKFSGDAKLTKFRITCPYCSDKREYRFEATFEIEA
jgi:hypothetical protein